ncbi:DUF4111 domain-containing protein [Citrobacter freundii]|uniref:aminoglycoside adenylyltransferase domain-containing protein n=1 Tax=Citrobacter TaxID=544 RepID=UPI000778A55D|nr:MULTISPECIES: aminoglycoside adenylyltransferase domain-containing protein [Citrobacter]EJR7283756.1 DUF4111 domain-containing protein [Citrobacter freundii]EKT9241762.1 DUF4111 domain-containing protein [Citrobacter freundii]EKW8507806.1 DUF4111 domain-containing protein [Citrobacter freundii]EMB4319019.1 DUF4111 domain-containing protein [Citrobacter freundii]KYC23723.1 aminoglycoside resistance protein [Citrobacter sp. AATXQ]
MSATIPDSIRRQVNAASALIERIIEGDLVAVHLYGYAVEGGLKPQSDIDLLVTIRQPLNTRQRNEAASWLIPQLPVEYADTLQAARAEYLGLTKKNWAESMQSVERFVFYAKKQIAVRLE